jgi:hypothetical protein
VVALLAPTLPPAQRWLRILTVIMKTTAEPLLCRDRQLWPTYASDSKPVSVPTCRERDKPILDILRAVPDHWPQLYVFRSFALEPPSPQAGKADLKLFGNRVFHQ